MRHSIFPVVLAWALLPNVSAFSGKEVRIMPLGASITFGVGSSDGNGYRYELHNLLVRDGNEVNMVGNHYAENSTFYDKDTEGWSGAVIDEVAAKMRLSMPRNRPNVVTVLCGTNDMSRNLNVAEAPSRMGRMIDEILDFPPLTTVIVSSLPPNRNSAANTRIQDFNAALPDVVRRRVEQNRSVLFADCGSLLTLDDLPDGIHPNDAGFKRIGKCFYDSIVEAEARGWLWPVDGPEPGPHPTAPTESTSRPRGSMHSDSNSPTEEPKSNLSTDKSLDNSAHRLGSSRVMAWAASSLILLQLIVS